MALLERVATLVRANLNDLIDKAEDPEKMIKQVILDMQNQLLQVKTQVAIAIADQHLLQKKRTRHEDRAAEWMRKAELAVDKQQDDLARAALERSRASPRWPRASPAGGRSEGAGRHPARRSRKLDQKLSEAQCEERLLIAQHRRARALGKRDRRPARRGRTRPGGRLRPDGAEGPPRGGDQSGQVHADRRGCGSPI